MNKVISTWNWLDGKKSVIGGYALGAAALLQYVGASYGVAIPNADLAIKALTDVGGVLTGVGAFHKGFKLMTAQGQG